MVEYYTHIRIYTEGIFNMAEATNTKNETVKGNWNNMSFRNDILMYTNGYTIFIDERI